MDSNGRRYKENDLTAPITDLSRKFTWRGVTPRGSRGWAYSLEKLEELWNVGLIHVKTDGSPSLRGHKNISMNTMDQNCNMDRYSSRWQYGQGAPWLPHPETAGTAGSHHQSQFKPRRHGAGPLLRLRHCPGGGRQAGAPMGGRH